MKKTVSSLLVFSLVVSLLFSISTGASAAEVDYSPYADTVEVNPRDTIFGICNSRGLVLSEVKQAIMIMNGMTTEKSLSTISEGQTLFIPKSAKDADRIVELFGKQTSMSGPIILGEAEKTVEPKYYIVTHTMQSGETLFSVSNSLGVPYSEASDIIAGLNGLKNGGKVFAGMDYYFLSTSPENAEYTVFNYTIASGDTMSGICKANGVDYKQVSGILQALNPGMNFNAIRADHDMLMVSDVITQMSPSIVIPASGEIPASAALYESVTDVYATALKEGWSREQCLNSGVNFLVPSYSLTTLGYCLRDVNGDGTDELLIGNGTLIIAMYTIYNGKPALVFDGYERSSYYLEPDGVIVNRCSNSAFQSGYRLCRLVGKSLILSGAIISDFNANQSAPWYYAEDDDWNVGNDQKVTTAKAEAWVKAYEDNYVALPYIQFS